jgi:drug/metabolite transporter (DMT)-like permease
MPVALLGGLTAAVAWGIMDVAAAIAGRRLGSLRTVVIEQFGSLAGLGLFVLVIPSALGPQAAAGVLAAIPLGVISSVAFVTQFAALRAGPVAVVSPLVAAYGGFTVLFAVVLRGEVLHPIQALGAVMATAGIILTGIIFHSRSLRTARFVGPGVLLAVVSAVAFGLASTLIAGPVREYGTTAAIAGSRIGNTVCSLALFIFATTTGTSVFRPLLSSAPIVWRMVVLVLIVGAGDIAGFLAFGAGLNVGPVWLVGLVSSFGPVLGVIFGVVWLKERLRPTQWLGMLLIAVALVILSVT